MGATFGGGGMRRKPSADAGSLDLLLDTICNAFGGIVFIALLLAIVTQQVGYDQEGAYQDGTLPPTVLRLRSEIRIVEEEISRLKELVDDEIRPPEKEQTESEREYHRLIVETRLLKERNERRIREVTRLEEEITKTNQELQALDRVLAKVKGELQNQAKDKTVVKRLPVSTPVPRNMGQFWMFVQKGRLHLVDSFDPETRFHQDVIILEETHSGTLVTVRNQKGQRIQPGFDRQESMFAFLQRTSPKRHVVQVMVDKLSFEEFNLLKKVLISRGYRYFFDIGTTPIRFVPGSDFEHF